MLTFIVVLQKFKLKLISVYFFHIVISRNVLSMVTLSTIYMEKNLDANTIRSHRLQIILPVIN